MNILISIGIAALGMWVMKRFSAMVGLVILVFGVIGVLAAVPGAMGFVESVVTAAGSAAETFINEVGQ